ncbi:EF_hand domain-containing protein [Hexamita inflata]|uniref:EF hand domain-containing protein n=1 Tax=Hexamita inflata TaxID=28002 RepID=A0AA86VRZ6_9EUKA|nr:EF hand domain-containing protein [Hexamita inflata]
MGCTSSTTVKQSELQIQPKDVNVIDHQRFHVPDKQMVHTAFRGLDKNQSGKLDQDEVIYLFKLLGKQLEKEELQYVLTLADQDIDACLDENEFFHLMYILTNSGFDEREKIVFLMTDINCSGTIDCKELGSLLKKLEINATTEKIQELVSSTADKIDGTMSYNMFMALLTKLAE